MKKIFTLIITSFIYSLTINAQEVVLQRTSDLMPQLYTIQGQAFLEELDNGDLTLRLSSDFSTPPGPDVRILLGNSLSVNGATEVVNLSSIGHFSGARTFTVPSSVGINDFDNILFFCVNFQQFWASGLFGEAIDPNGGQGFTCEESTVSILNTGDTAANICPTDNVSDLIAFNNSLGESSSNYAYLITDQNNVLQEVVSGASYDFEGSSSSIQRVHGIHFDGDLIPVLGANRLQTTASGCFTHSETTGFITIDKTATCVTSFQCEESLTATTAWVTSVDICPTDSQDDWVVLRNNLFIAPGDHYAYLITDTNEILQSVVLDSIYNFEGTSLNEQRVYGIHYDGTLNPIIGQNRSQTTASGCFTHSGGNLFLTINKTACENFECKESLTATTNWVTQVDLCATDGLADDVILKNNVFEPAGDHYVYLITDESEILQEIVFDSTYNFEGSGVETQRVYGLSYSGTLDPQIGQNRINTTASDCFIHSGGNLFITVDKTAGCTVTSVQEAFLQDNIEVYPNPSDGTFSIDYNEVSDVRKIQLFDNNGRLLQDWSTLNQFEVSNSGMYFIRFITDDGSTTKKIFMK